MRTDVRIDNQKVVAPNASLLAGRGRIVKAGDFIVYRTDGMRRIGRSLGRLRPNGSRTTFILTMELADDATFAYERWIKPDAVLEVIKEAPTKFIAFFFAERLPADADMLRRLMEHGTVCHRYIDNLEKRIAELRK